MMILQPVIALAAWTMVMCLWMYATRLPAMSAAKIDPDSLVQDPNASLSTLLPREVCWKADNFNHLHEAPTIFYAVALSIAVMAAMSDSLSTSALQWATAFAWIYVALRIIHSLVQSLGKRVVVRFALFALSQITLLGLIIVAAKGALSLGSIA